MTNIRALIKTALSTVDERYGPHSGRYLPYHNLLHSQDVARAAARIGKSAALNGRLDPSDIPLLSIAGAFHDIVHGVASGENERLSAAEAEATLSKSNVFSSKEIERVKKLILATEVIGLHGGIIRNVDPDDYATLIIADADLCAFGMPCKACIRRINRYYKEQVSEKPGLTYKRFIASQVDLLNKHRYLTPEAALLFPHSASNAKWLQGSLQDNA